MPKRGRKRKLRVEDVISKRVLLKLESGYNKGLSVLKEVHVVNYSPTKNALLVNFIDLDSPETSTNLVWVEAESLLSNVFEIIGDIA